MKKYEFEIKSLRSFVAKIARDIESLDSKIESVNVEYFDIEKAFAILEAKTLEFAKATRALEALEERAKFEENFEALATSYASSVRDSKIRF